MNAILTDIMDDSPYKRPQT